MERNRERERKVNRGRERGHLTNAGGTSSCTLVVVVVICSINSAL